MAQIFHRSTNLISRVSIYGAILFVGVLGFGLYEIALSSWYTGQHMHLQQPVPFSHRHHAGELGIDCRYCHTSVEKSSFAGVPPTQTCMTCHSQIWTSASMLEPVRASYRDDTSLEWQRVNALPDFVYFDHSIHLAKGIGCTSCHGQIAEMPLTERAGTLYMSGASIAIVSRRKTSGRKQKYSTRTTSSLPKHTRSGLRESTIPTKWRWDGGC